MSDDAEPRPPWYLTLRGWLATSPDDRVQALVEDPSLADYVEQALDEIKRIDPLHSGSNKPIESTYDEVAALLRDMSERVALGDSFEGSIEYSMPDVPEWAQRGEPKPDGWRDPDVLVRAVYRIGNTQGQGGVRIVGSINR